MKGYAGWGVWLAVALGCVLVACARGPRSFEMRDGFVTPLSVDPPPIYALMGFRVDLELTSEQVAGLDAIATDVQDRNRPLLADLAENRRRNAREPGVFRVTPETEPVVEEIRANNRRASEAVAGLLTEAQRVDVCDLFGRQGPAARRAGVAGFRGAAAQSDTAAASNPAFRTIWHWCAPGGRNAAPDPPAALD